jgi:hypothetical protein
MSDRSRHNRLPELRRLKGIRGIDFAEAGYSGGILEGIKKYKLIEKAARHYGITFSF